MRTQSSITLKLAIVGLVAGLALVCCRARLTMAQVPPQPPSQTAPQEALAPPVEQTTNDLPPATVLSPVDPPAPAREPAPQLAVPTVSRDARNYPATVSSSAPASTLETGDPEKVAKEFVEQNQKQAETRLKSLKDEAEKLRSRLLKVEAGIRRWETLLIALKQSQDVARPDVPEGFKAAAEHGPADAFPPQPTSTIEGPAARFLPEPSTAAPKAVDPTLPRG